MGDEKKPEKKAKVFEFTGGERINPVKSPTSTQDTERESTGGSNNLPEQELFPDDGQDTIVHAESGLTVREVFLAFNDSEIGLSRLFTRVFRNKFCFNTSLGRWFIYRGSCWHLDTRNEQIDACRELYELLVFVKRQYLSELTKNMEKKIVAELKGMTQIGEMKNILNQGAAGKEGLGVAGEDFDKMLNKIGAPNGIIEIETGKLLPSDPELYTTKQVGAPYDPEAPEPVFFKNFLHEVFKYPVDKNKMSMSEEDFQAVCEEQCEAIVEYIQTLFGYAILGSCREHIFVCFWGMGRNGKGVLLRTIINAIGDYGGEIQPSILLSSKATSAESPTPAIGDLKGLRLAVASETNQAQFFDTGAVKRLTGGDTLVFRKPYAKDFVRFKPSHTLILQTNFRPNAPAEDVAFWKRVHVVPFLRSFVSNPDLENPYQAKIDKDLEEKLRKELPGILRWVVEGAKKYLENGLNPPDCVKNAVDDYRLSGDFIVEFIDECCNTGKDLKVRTTAFAQALNEWRKLQGYRSPLSSSVITERLEYKGFIKRKASYMCYKGLELNAIGTEHLKPLHERNLDYGTENPFMDPAMNFCNQTDEVNGDFSL